MDNRKTDGERLVQKLLSLPRREQAAVRRLLIRMWNTDTPRSHDEWTEIANAELRHVGCPPISNRA